MTDYAKLTFKLFFKLGFNQLILSAGMPRSASTLLYNIIRLCLYKKFGDNLTSGWIGDINFFKKNKINLIKVHQINSMLAMKAKYIFYTYRDVRQALVSANIKFNTPLTIISCRKMIDQYEMAKKYADLMISYENIVNNTKQQISRIANILKIDVDIEDIIKNLPLITSNRFLSEGKKHNLLTALHENHASGIYSDEWNTILSEELKKQIGIEFKWWFKETDYIL